MSLREPPESSGTEKVKYDLLDYEVDHEVGRGGSSVVYSARCKSGRLRGRILAVKQIFTSAVATVSLPSTNIHRTLFHPSILSLLDTFAINNSHYQVLEYCPNGNLLDRVRSSPTHSLSEPELRGVVRCLVDGLSYLRKELVIHCDINPGNILISDSWRVKIAGFDFAVLAASEVASMRHQHPYGNSAYRSPELVARGPYGFSTDIWSLGALVFTCLTGKHAFNASSDEETNCKIVHADYPMPSNASYELQRFISRSLEVDPRKRISLQEISSHPFMESTLPVVSLNYNISRLVAEKPAVISWSKPAVASKYPAYLSKFAPARTDDLLAAYERDSEKPCHPLFSGNQDLRMASMPTSTSGSSADSTFSLLKREDLVIRRTASTSQLLNVSSKSVITHAQTPASGSVSSPVSVPKSDTDRLAAFFQHRPSPLRANLDSDSEHSGDSEDSLSDLGPSKTYNQPVEPPTPEFLTANARIAQFRFDTKPSSLQDTSDLATENFKNRTGGSQTKGRPVVLPPSSPSTQEGTTTPARSRFQPPISELPFPFPPTPPAHNKKQQIPQNTFLAPRPRREREGYGTIPRPQWVPRVAAPAVPPAPSTGPINSTVSDSTKPAKLNTSHLTPHTYKTVKGQVTILPSRSLLLDLREGERRKGKKGDEVLVISPNGDNVYVYSAPHLSTPCCLAEPSAEYTYDDLPREYWGRYADAVKAVYQVKQRVPKFVRYTPTAKCTLMANEPFGDVEVVIYAGEKCKELPTAKATSTTKLKLRLRQEKRTLEITRHTVSLSAQVTAKSAPATSNGSTAAIATTKPTKTPQIRNTAHIHSHAGDMNPEVAGTTVLSKKIVPVVRAGYEMELVDSLGAEGLLDEDEMHGVGVVREFLGVVRVVEGIQGVQEGGGKGVRKGGEKEEERIESCVKSMESLSVDEGESGGTTRSFQPVGESEKAVVKTRKMEGWVNRGDSLEVTRTGAIVVPGSRSQLRVPMKRFAGSVDTSAGLGSGSSDSGYPDTGYGLGGGGTCVEAVASRTAQDQGPARPLTIPSGRVSSWGSSGSLARVVVPARPARLFSGGGWRSRSETGSSESGSSSESKSRNTSGESL